MNKKLSKFCIGFLWLIIFFIVFFLLFVGYVDCFKHTHSFLVGFRKLFKIKQFLNFLQATAGAGFFISIIVYLYKYILELDKREKIEGFIKDYKISNDKKRLTITLNLKNKGNYPIEFEFIERQDKTAVADFIYYYCKKNELENLQLIPYIPYRSEKLGDYLSFSQDDRASVDKKKIREGKNGKETIVYDIYMTNDVYRPVFINNEIYQNFVYMRVINNNDNIDNQNVNYHQNVFIPSHQELNLILDISKGYKINNVDINKVLLYSKTGTLFTIKNKNKKKINVRNG